MTCMAEIPNAEVEEALSNLRESVSAQIVSMAEAGFCPQCTTAAMFAAIVENMKECANSGPQDILSCIFSALEIVHDVKVVNLDESPDGGMVH